MVGLIVTFSVKSPAVRHVVNLTVGPSQDVRTSSSLSVEGTGSLRQLEAAPRESN